MNRTIFDEIIDGTIPSWKLWEDEDYLAFLTPFPNTPGLTVVIPKSNPGDYIFDITPEAAHGLINATTKVAKALEKALGVARVAMVLEGTGVAHVHAKLYPLQGELGAQTNLWTKHQEFYPEYPGYVTTVEGPRMRDDELDALQEKIKKVIADEN